MTTSTTNNSLFSSLMIHSVSLFISFVISSHARKKKSLSLSGAIAAFFVGYSCFLNDALQLFRLNDQEPYLMIFTLILLFFFYSSSKITKFKGEIKKNREMGFKMGSEGERNYKQVFANGFFPSLLAVIHYFIHGRILENTLLWGYISCYITSMSDTWSSEIGILSKTEPCFILNPLKKVPFGTNGGVSLLGMSASVLSGVCGGLIIYISHIMFIVATGFKFKVLLNFWKIEGICIFISLCGTVVDSVLGATLEASILDTKLQKILKFSQISQQILKDCSNNSNGKKNDEIQEARPNELQHYMWISGHHIFSGNTTNFVSTVLMSLITMAILAPRMQLIPSH